MTSKKRFIDRIGVSQYQDSVLQQKFLQSHITYSRLFQHTHMA